MEFRGTRDPKVDGFDRSDDDDADESAFLHPSVRNGLYPFFFIHSGQSGTSSSTGRVPLELEFIGTCTAVGPKIVITTAHHYDTKSDDVGRFGVLVECDAAASKLLRGQQEASFIGPARNGNTEKPVVPKMVAARRRASKRPASKPKEATPKRPPVPRVIFANERLYYLVPCRYGAKAPASINFFNGQDASAKDTKAKANSDDDKTVTVKKQSKTVLMPPPPKAVSTNINYKISPDLAVFWLESPLPFHVSSPANLSACSPVEDVAVTTVFYEPPQTRLTGHAVGSYAFLPTASSSTATTERAPCLFGKGPQTSAPTVADCLLITPKAAAVLRMVVLAMRTQSLPELVLSRGQVLCGIACEGYYRDAAEPKEESPSLPKIKREGDEEKAERRRKARIVYDVDDGDDNQVAQRTRVTNTMKGRTVEGKINPYVPPPSARPPGFGPSHHMKVELNDSDDEEVKVQVHPTGRSAIMHPGQQATEGSPHRVIVPAVVKVPSHGFWNPLGLKRIRDDDSEDGEAHSYRPLTEASRGACAAALGDSVASDSERRTTSYNPSNSPAAAAPILPSLTMSGSPLVWWHSCLTRKTVTPYGSSGGAVVDASGSLIVGMHVATNNLFTYYRYYGPKQERILRNLHIRQKQWHIQQLGNERAAHKEGTHASENEAFRKEAEEDLACLQATFRSSAINTVPPKDAKDERISEFLTSRSLIQALASMEVYLNAAE